MTKIIDYKEQLEKNINLINKVYCFNGICTNTNGHAPIHWTEEDIFYNIRNLCLLIFGIDIDSNMSTSREYLDKEFEDIISSNIDNLYRTVIAPKIDYCIYSMNVINNFITENAVKINDWEPVFKRMMDGLKQISINDNSNIIDKFRNIYNSRHYINYTDEEVDSIKKTVLTIRDELINYVNELEMPSIKDWEDDYA